MKTELRVVSGSLKGRRIEFETHQDLRPTPLRVREALFSILGQGLAGMPFFDVFGGTGINGLEALSRGASRAVFIERDFQLAAVIEKYLKKFQVWGQARVLSTDAYRWAARLLPQNERSIIFISPPFADLVNHKSEIREMIQAFQEKFPPATVICIQIESDQPMEDLPGKEPWDKRTYGRNELCFWVKGENPTPVDAANET